MANDSGKHNGESWISSYGRHLRYALYEAAVSLIGKNEEVKEVHKYYWNQKKEPLKKMQSVDSVACRGTRVFYAIFIKGVD